MRYRYRFFPTGEDSSIWETIEPEALGPSECHKRVPVREEREGSGLQREVDGLGGGSGSWAESMEREEMGIGRREDEVMGEVKLLWWGGPYCSQGREAKNNSQNDGVPRTSTVVNMAIKCEQKLNCPA